MMGFGAAGPARQERRLPRIADAAARRPKKLRRSVMWGTAVRSGVVVAGGATGGNIPPSIRSLTVESLGVLLPPVAGPSTAYRPPRGESMKRLVFALALVAAVGACKKAEQTPAAGAADSSKMMMSDTTKAMADTSKMMMSDTSKHMMGDTSKAMKKKP